MEFIVSLLPMIVLFAVMYFLLIRPQKKVADQKKQMIAAIKPGDHVVTIGGLHGVIDEVNDAERTVILDCEGVYLTFELSAVATVKSSAPLDGVQVDALSPEPMVDRVDVDDTFEIDAEYDELEEH